MRVLTVRQPWAWAIIHGGKNVENRSRNIAGSYRGPVAIHAGLSTDPTGWDWLYENRPDLWGKAMPGAGTREMDKGSIIGVVDLVDVHYCHRAEDECSPFAGKFPCSPWGDTYGTYHLVLENRRPFAEPIPAKGRLGLWKPDANLLAEIENGDA